MAESSIARLTDDILSALGTTESLESWLRQHLGSSADSAVLTDTFRAVTQRLLGTEPPQTARWERLMVGAAGQVSGSDGDYGFGPCKAAIAELTEMIQEEAFSRVSPEQILTFASALTLVLTAQRKLRQPIENAMASLCQKFPDLLPDMAERCQDIWRRRGQMSGAEGLYVWDTRTNEWRLHQDFKSHRPTSS